MLNLQNRGKRTEKLSYISSPSDFVNKVASLIIPRIYKASIWSVKNKISPLTELLQYVLYIICMIIHMDLNKTLWDLLYIFKMKKGVITMKLFEAKNCKRNVKVKVFTQTFLAWHLLQEMLDQQQSLLF